MVHHNWQAGDEKNCYRWPNLKARRGPDPSAEIGLGRAIKINKAVEKLGMHNFSRRFSIKITLGTLYGLRGMEC